MQVRWVEYFFIICIEGLYKQLQLLHFVVIVHSCTFHTVEIKMLLNYLCPEPSKRIICKAEYKVAKRELIDQCISIRVRWAIFNYKETQETDSAVLQKILPQHVSKVLFSARNSRKCLLSINIHSTNCFPWNMWLLFLFYHNVLFAWNFVYTRWWSHQQRRQISLTITIYTAG